jgi:DNA polymerase III delta subunit
MKKIFILEDNDERIKFFKWYFKNPEYQVFYAKEVNEAKALFTINQPFEVMFLDHDLGDQVYVDSNEQNTGYQFAKFIIEKDLSKSFIIIHSLNPYGAENIKSVLKEAMQIPFTVLAAGLVNGEIKI